MAHTPKKKAEVIADVLVKGLTYDEAETKHGVPKGTISKWVTASKTKQETKPKRNSETIDGRRQVTPAQRQKAEFDQRLVKLLGSSLDMLESWASECQDPDFIKRNPEGVNELGRTVLERCDRILELVRNIGDGSKQ
jgi:transposase-like protein